MGLENLKSVFSEGAGTNNSQISGRLTGGGELGPFVNHPDEFSQLDFDTNVPTPVDFLTGNIEGFTINFDNKGEGNGNSKYIGQISELADNQTIGFTPLVQPPLVEPLAGIKRNIGLQTIGENSNIFDSDGNFKFIEQKISYGPLSISNPNDKSIQFETLYNTNQTAKSIKQKSDRLNIRFKSSQVPTNRGDEPYIVSNINSNAPAFGRDFPLERSVIDGIRITKFLTSRKGVEFIAKQNALGLNSEVVFNNQGKKESSNQRFQTSYNPASTLGSLARTLGGQIPNFGFDGFLLSREDPFPLDPTRIFKARNYMEHLRVRDVFGDFAEGVASLFNVERDNATAAPIQEGEFYGETIDKTKNIESLETSFGDKITLQKMIKGDSLGTNSLNDAVGKAISFTETDIESEKAGLPLYFKDLRDNTYVFFRGYLSGITENVSPSWAAENYIGRSEPVYIYERSERDINFSLKLFATTKDELPMIYKKMDRLTSMCYPQYQRDNQLVNKVRMKPPLVKFRLGDMYGSENNEMTGWIKSISYTVPDNSVWETQKGKKVAKHVEASIGFQIIHGSPPELKTNFYGFPSKNLQEDFDPSDPLTAFSNIKDTVVNTAINKIGEIIG